MLKYYLTAWKFVNEHKLYRFFLLSMFLYLLVFLLSLVPVYFLASSLNHFIEHVSFVIYIREKFSYIKWLLTLFNLGIIIALAYWVSYIYKYIFLAIASPLYAYISDKVYEKLFQQSIPFSFPFFIKNVLRGICISLINVVRQTFYIMLLLLLSVIPGVGIFFVIINIIIDAYYYGFSMLDYNCERENFSVSKSRRLINTYKWNAITIGFPLWLSLAVPVIGTIFFAPLSCIAATILFYEKKWHLNE